MKIILIQVKHHIYFEFIFVKLVIFFRELSIFNPGADISLAFSMDFLGNVITASTASACLPASSHSAVNFEMSYGNPEKP